MTPDTTLDRAAAAFGWEGQLVEIQLREGPVAVAVQLDRAEHERRTRAGVEALTDRRLLTALWELPEGLAIPSVDIPSWAQDVIGPAGQPVVEAIDSTVVRVVRSPLRIIGALAPGRGVAPALARVSQLSAVSAMGVVAQGSVRPDDPGLLNARLYGVGVVTELNGSLTTLCLPEPVVPMPGPFMWWVAEVAYDQLRLQLTPGSLSGGPPTS